MSLADAEGAPLDLTFDLVVETADLVAMTESQLEALTRSVLEAEGATGCWEVAVALVDDMRLQALHRDFMGIDSPTDIMTFPADSDNEGKSCRGGEMAISVDHARTQASAWGLSPEAEIRFLVVHGLLHLLGWRDDVDADRERMLARQQELLDRWRESGMK